MLFSVCLFGYLFICLFTLGFGEFVWTLDCLVLFIIILFVYCLIVVRVVWVW